MALAVSGYQHGVVENASASQLNLAWTVDEQKFLAADVKKIVRQVLVDELNEDLKYIQSYFVNDPFGDAGLRPSVARYLGLNESEFQLSAAAGINTLLYAIARLVEQRTVYVVGDIYPDLPHWLKAAGAQCVSRRSAELAASDIENIRRLRPALVHLEHPNLMGETASISGLSALITVAGEVGAMVVVDEAYANYLPPEKSTAALVCEFNNLVILRGISKGYWLGGVRLGYAIASTKATKQLRNVLVPMSASSLSYRIGKCVLECGDVAAPLRQRIAIVKGQIADQLNEAKLPIPTGLHSSLPYLVWPNDDWSEVYEKFCMVGIMGKKHLYWRGDNSDEVSTCFRMSIPLKESRLGKFSELMRGF